MLEQIFTLTFFTAFLAATVGMAVPLIYATLVCYPWRSVSGKNRNFEHRAGRRYVGRCIRFFSRGVLQ